MEEWKQVYRIVGKIGEGSGGEVYKAYHTRLQKQVVLKRIKGKYENQSSYRREVDLLKNLHHPYLPQVLDFVEIENDVYTVMDYVKGLSLQQVVQNNKQMVTVAECIKWLKQLCLALDYLHRQKPSIIHGDVKPSNIMIRDNGDLCLIDFNTAFSLDQKEFFVGFSSQYAAPEQKRIYMAIKNNEYTRERIDVRTDIYCVGATFRYVLEQKDGEYIEDDKKRKCLERVINKAMQLDPTQRYQNIGELYQDVKAIDENQIIERKHGKYKKHIAIFLGSVLLAGCIVVGYWMHIQHENRECENIYKNVVTLFEQSEYEKTIDYISDQVIDSDRKWRDENLLSEVYYLLGNCYLQKKDYEDAVQYLEEAIHLSSQSESEYYRDYAVALAHCGKLDEAEEQLNRAEKNGITDKDIQYTEGEIYEVKEEYDSALDCYRQCVVDNEDEYMVMRAYLAGASCMEEEDANNLSRIADWLESGGNDISGEYRVPVLEKLAQIYINDGDINGESQSYQRAVDTLQKIVDMDQGQFSTFDTMVVLDTKLGEYQRAQEILGTMKSDYGDDYVIYKRYAFLELKIEEQKPDSERDYLQFVKYYDVATELYSKQVKNNQDDLEMNTLNDAYQQLIRGGWIDS